jgi:tRNA-dihydrouridine synthase B
VKLRIGNVTLDNNLILAPMAGVTDLPFRFLCREQGCGMAVTEMVSAKAILYKNRNTKELLEVADGEGPVSVQLFGSDPSIMADMAAQIESGPFAFIDVNMGCPVTKIVKNGEGSALMKDIKLAERILSSMVKAVKKPVTVKFRKGFAEDDINAVEFAKMAESSGVAAVAVHGRTRIIPEPRTGISYVKLKKRSLFRSLATAMSLSRRMPRHFWRRLDVTAL